MRKRLFIAINLSSEVKNYLIRLQKKWSYLDVRWAPADNIHLTLFFLGGTDINAIPAIAGCCRQAMENISPFELKLNSVSLGPTPRNPRLVWISIEENDALRKLWENLRDEFGEAGINFEHPNRKFTPHLTMARFQKAPEGFIAQNIDLRFTAKSFELIESELRPESAEYTILESFKF